jgi:hypothetical protein
MKRLLAIALLTLTLGGCATQFGTRIGTAWEVLTQTSVSPTQIVVAGNAFDAVEVTATNYLVYCKTNLNPLPQCDLVTRRRVIASVRAGRGARDQLEPYVVAGKAGPIVIYNALIEAIKAVKGNTPVLGAS